MRHDTHVVNAAGTDLRLNDVRVFTPSSKEEIAPRGELQREVRTRHGITEQIALLIDDPDAASSSR